MGNFFSAIFSPIGSGIGWLMNLIFEGINAIGIGNVGLAIILITVIVKVAMLPLLMSQLKQAKLSRYMAPELRAVRAKYRGRRDERLRNYIISTEYHRQVVVSSYSSRFQFSSHSIMC